MQGKEAARDNARNAVRNEAARQGLGPYELAKRAGIDPDTASDFLSGKRWPVIGTRAKISEALGWPAERIDAIEHGQVVVEDALLPSAPEEASDPLDCLVPSSALDGLDEVGRAEVLAAARLSALQAARAIRSR